MKAAIKREQLLTRLILLPSDSRLDAQRQLYIMN